MSVEEMSSLEITHELDRLEEILSSSVVEKCFSIVNDLEERHVIFESECYDTMQNGTFYKEWVSEFPRNQMINRYLELMLLDRGIDIKMGKRNGDFVISLVAVIFQ